MRKARKLPLILLSLLPGCGLFAGGHPLLTTQSAGCSTLIPSAWKQPVAAPAIPDTPDVGALAAYGDAAVGRLDIANDRTVSTIGIMERCEARDAAAIHQATRRRLFGIF